MTNRRLTADAAAGIPALITATAAAGSGAGVFPSLPAAHELVTWAERGGHRLHGRRKTCQDYADSAKRKFHAADGRAVPPKDVSSIWKPD